MSEQSRVKTGKSDGAITLRTILGSVTGHAPEALDAELSLDQDLGLDSIKLVEILTKLLATLPEPARDELRQHGALRDVIAAETVGDLTNLYVRWLGEPAVVSDEAPYDPGKRLPSQRAQVTESTSVQVPLLDAQYPFLVAHWAVSTCSLVSSVRIRGKVDYEIVNSAYREIVARHPALRSEFVIPEGCTSLGEYQLHVHNDLTQRVELLDVRAIATNEQLQTIEDWKERAVCASWELAHAPLHRLGVFLLRDDEAELVFTNHHLVSDGLGNQRVIVDLLESYERHLHRQMRENLETTCPFPVDEYVQLVTDLNAWESVEEQQALTELYRRQRKAKRVLPLCSKPGRLAATACTRAELSSADLDAVNRCLRQIDVSLNTILVAAYLDTLRQFADGTAAITINIPTSGRLYPQTDASGWVGCFAQNMALECELRCDRQSWVDYLCGVEHNIESTVLNGCDRAEVKRAAEAARRSLRLEDGRINDQDAALIRAGIRTPYYLSFVGAIGIRSQYHGFEIVDYEARTTTNAGAIDCLVEVVCGTLHVTVNYDSNAYESSFARCFGETFVSRIREIANQVENSSPAHRQRDELPCNRITASDFVESRVLAIASELARRPIGKQSLQLHLEADLGFDSLQRIRLASRIGREYPSASRRELVKIRSLAGIVANLNAASSSGGCLEGVAQDKLPLLQIIRTAERFRDHPAVVFGDTTVTYGELDRWSNQLARDLTARGVRRESRVGLLCLPGPEMLVALLGIAKAGAAYVPLDPQYPEARLTYIAQHAGLVALVTQHEVSRGLRALLLANTSVPFAVFSDLPPAASLRVAGDPRPATRGGDDGFVAGTAWHTQLDTLPDTLPSTTAENFSIGQVSCDGAIWPKIWTNLAPPDSSSISTVSVPT